MCAMCLSKTTRVETIFRAVRRGQAERKQTREQRSRGLVYRDQSVSRVTVARGQKSIPTKHTHTHEHYIHRNTSRNKKSKHKQKQKLTNKQKSKKKKSTT